MKITFKYNGHRYSIYHDKDKAREIVKEMIKRKKYTSISVQDDDGQRYFWTQKGGWLTYSK